MKYIKRKFSLLLLCIFACVSVYAVTFGPQGETGFHAEGSLVWYINGAEVIAEPSVGSTESANEAQFTGNGSAYYSITPPVPHKFANSKVVLDSISIYYDGGAGVVTDRINQVTFGRKTVGAASDLLLINSDDAYEAAGVHNIGISDTTLEDAYHYYLVVDVVVATAFDINSIKITAHLE